MAVRRGKSDARWFGFACLCALACVLLLVASTFASPNPSGPGWRRADLLPVTQPVAIGGRFVFYEASGRRLHVVALDARTGKTAWSLPASISGMTQGVAPALDVAGSNVIALLRATPDSPLAAVAAIDVRTGTVAWASAPGRFTSTPGPCV